MKYLLIIIICIQKQLNWWSHGHMIIAKIAEIHLKKDSPEILTRIFTMLQPLNKFFPENVNSILEPSVIPDILMNQFNLFLDFFHYTNKPIIYKNDDFSDVTFNPTNPYNITYAFEQSMTIIKESQNKEKEKSIKNGLIDSLMLRYLLHITGDSHQPLHSANFYSCCLYDGKIKKGDQGGNLIEVYNVFEQKMVNLHKIWDSAFWLYHIDFELPLTQESQNVIKSDSEDLMLKYSKEFFGDDVQILDYQEWIQESFDIAKTFTYIDIDLFPLLRSEYIMKGREICQQRIALAGYRLANILMDLFNNQFQIKTKISNIHKMFKLNQQKFFFLNKI